MFIERLTQEDIDKFFDNDFFKVSMSKNDEYIGATQYRGTIAYYYKLYDFDIDGPYHNTNEWVKYLAVKFGDEYLQHYKDYLIEKMNETYMEIANEVSSKEIEDEIDIER